MNYRSRIVKAVVGKLFGIMTLMTFMTVSSPQAEASFTNVSVSAAQIANGRYVYSVYAHFSAATDQIAKVKNWHVTSGTMMNVQHSDAAMPLGSWNPIWSTAEDGAVASDSYVSITGLWNDQGTVLSWTNGGSSIVAGASWGLPAMSSGGVIVGSTLKVKIMQIAGLNLVPQIFQFSAGLDVDWRSSATMPNQTGSGTFTIPSPGSLLLGSIALVTKARSRTRRD
ncbi:MAG: hypothetical protein EXS17_02045 [Phycisphaerales bacterium]|nr:hypothetical protein [Phycisphaerales bacterium]